MTPFSRPGTLFKKKKKAFRHLSWSRQIKIFFNLVFMFCGPTQSWRLYAHKRIITHAIFCVSASLILDHGTGRAGYTTGSSLQTVQYLSLGFLWETNNTLSLLADSRSKKKSHSVLCSEQCSAHHIFISKVVATKVHYAHARAAYCKSCMSI